MIDSLVGSGAVTLIALAVLVLELILIVGSAVSQRTWPRTHLLANALSGLCLILALRAALLDQGNLAVALFLGLAGAAHLVDVTARLRQS